MIDIPGLSSLYIVNDAGAMAGHFDNYLHRLGLDPAWHVADCAIEKVYFRWPKRCDILYRVKFRHVSGAAAEEWIYGQTFRTTEGHKRYRKSASKRALSVKLQDFLQDLPPVSFWEDFDMIVWIFPADPDLATLPEVIDPEFVHQQIAANPAAYRIISGEGARGKQNNWRCSDIRFDRIKHMPRKRCVLRFRVNLTNDAGESREVTFYSKTSKNSENRYHFDLLQKAYEEVDAANSAVNIPRPLLYFDGYETVWQADWAGKAVIDVFRQFDPELFFPRIAGMIAAFHQSAIAALPPAPGPDEILQTAAEDGGKLAHVLPQFRALVERVLRQLQESRPLIAWPEAQAMVPIHGACRMEQMLLKGDELALVDFDALACGDPLADIAEFIVSLDYLEISEGYDRNALAAAGRILLDSYAGRVVWPCRQPRIAWYVLAFLMGKMYSTIKNFNPGSYHRLHLAGSALVERWLAQLEGSRS